METEQSFAREEQRMFHVKQSKKQHKDSQKGFMYETLLEFDTEYDVSRETIHAGKTRSLFHVKQSLNPRSNLMFHTEHGRE